MRKVISPALSPNLRFADVATSVHSLLIPHELQLGDSLNFAGLYLKKMFHCPNVFMFMRAREGQYMLFKALGVKKKDEIIVQAFTCAAVVQPILWAGAKPVYVDISEEHFSMEGLYAKHNFEHVPQVAALQNKEIEELVLSNPEYWRANQI